MDSNRNGYIKQGKNCNTNAEPELYLPFSNHTIRLPEHLLNRFLS